MESLPIVPFGKYKGKCVTELLADTTYVAWLKQQPFFQQHPQIHNIVVHQTISNGSTNANAKTPEHNRLQNSFLNEQTQLKLINKFFDITRADTSAFENEEFIQHFGRRTVPNGWGQPTVSIEFEAKFNWDLVISFRSSRHGKDVSNPMFEFPAEERREHIGQLNQFLSKYNMTLDFKYSHVGSVQKTTWYVRTKHDHCENAKIHCELKPTLGDDYPCVLRKMKNQIELTKKDSKGGFGEQLIFVLIVTQFESVSATRDELKAIFRQSNIRIVFTEDLFDELSFSLTQPNEMDKLRETIRQLQTENAQLRSQLSVEGELSVV